MKTGILNEILDGAANYDKFRHFGGELFGLRPIKKQLGNWLDSRGAPGKISGDRRYLHQSHHRYDGVSTAKFLGFLRIHLIFAFVSEGRGNAGRLKFIRLIDVISGGP